MAQTDWNKQSAIAGYGGWVWAILGIAVMLWLGLRQPAQAQTDTAGPAPAIPVWVFVLVASIYVGGLIISSVLHWKARRPVEVNAAYRDAIVGELKEQVKALTAERDNLHSEVARLNQHRVDLIGSTVVELKDKSTSAAAEPRVLPEEPDLRIDYKKSSERERGALIFRIRSGPPTTIRKVGPVVSEQMYRTESEFVRLTDFIPDVEVGRDAECRILSPSLEQVLEAGGPTVSDSVVVDYTANNAEFSRRFFLYKNADGSIVSSTQDRKVAPNDLRHLRTILRSLGQSLSDLVYAGQLKALTLECGARNRS